MTAWTGIRKDGTRRAEPRPANGTREREFRSNGHPRTEEPPPPPPDGPEVGPDDPVLLDLAKLAATDPQPPRFIIPGWLPEGEVSLLAGDGGSGKSLVALTMAVCLAAGKPFFGTPVQQRPVAFLSYEDRQEALHWRLTRICRHMGINLADLPLEVYDGTRSDAVWFGSVAEYGQAGLGSTPAYARIRKRLAWQAPPGRVVVVDGSSDVFGASELDRGQVKRFIRMLRRLISEDGAVLLAAHVDKAGVKEGAEALGYSGSTGWNNGVRCRWHQYRQQEESAETGNVVVEVKKSNLGPIGHRMVLHFDTDLHIFQHVDEGPRHDPRYRAVDESEGILKAIRAAWETGNPVPAAMSGQRTAFVVCEAQPGFPATLKGSSGRRRFVKLVEDLRAAGAVVVEATKRPNRNFIEVLRARD